MIKKLFSIKDDLNGFMNIFLDMNDETAQRGFLHSLKTSASDSLFYSHPEDYHLYCVGEIDMESGIVNAYPTPKFICSGEKTW